LPYLQDDISFGEPVDIAHDAPTLSYLGKGNPEYRGIAPILQFLGTKDFFVTGSSRDLFGTRNLYYLYKSEDASMTIMRSWSDHWPNYNSLQSYPAQFIMDNWVKNLHDLVYLPVYATLIAQPVPEFDTTSGARLDPSQADLIAYANPQNWRTRIPLREDAQRNELNYFRAIRNLYQNFGWPDHFDCEGFLVALRQFQKDVENRDRQLKRSNPKAFWPIPGVTFTPEEMAMRRDKDDFLQEVAGKFALRRLGE